VKWVKSLKSNDIKPSELVRIPELEIHGVWGKVWSFIGHIHHIYYVISIAILLVLFSVFVPHYIWLDIWLKIQANGTLVSMLVIFTLVAVSLIWSAGQRIDVWIFMFFNMHGRRAPWLDWLMLSFTQIGNFVFALVVALILFLSGNKFLAYKLILGILTLGLVIGVMKILIHRTRPYIKLKNIRIIGSRASGQSFPSGHTGQSFFMATLLSHYFQVNIYIGIALYGVALLVGITRIYVGMHYPRDVIGGAILGTAWGLLGVIASSYIL